MNTKLVTGVDFVSVRLNGRPKSSYLNNGSKNQVLVNITFRFWEISSKSMDHIVYLILFATNKGTKAKTEKLTKFKMDERGTQTWIIFNRRSL